MRCRRVDRTAPPHLPTAFLPLAGNLAHYLFRSTRDASKLCAQVDRETFLRASVGVEGVSRLPNQDSAAQQALVDAAVLIRQRAASTSELVGLAHGYRHFFQRDIFERADIIVTGRWPRRSPLVRDGFFRSNKDRPAVFGSQHGFLANYRHHTIQDQPARTLNSMNPGDPFNQKRVADRCLSLDSTADHCPQHWCVSRLLKVVRRDCLSQIFECGEVIEAILARHRRRITPITGNRRLHRRRELCRNRLWLLRQTTGAIREAERHVLIQTQRATVSAYKDSDPWSRKLTPCL